MRRLILPLLAGLVGTAVLISLGLWQLQRLDWKQGVLSAIDARIGQAAGPLPDRPDPQADAFLPWVDYIGLLWALLMAEQQPGPEYQALIDINRQRLE